MNELSNLFLKIKSEDVIKLENKIYDVYEDDSFSLTGFFCSNTAKYEENPLGSRNTAIFIENKSNITIDGNGATLLIHGKMTPIILDKCKNITIKNLTIDYARPTMTEFKIISKENNSYIIKINDDCNYEIRDNILYWQGERDKNNNCYWEDSYIDNKRYIKIFNPITKKSRDFNRNNLEFSLIEEIEKGTLKVEFKNKEIELEEGSIVQTRSIIRDETGALFQRCKNLKFENLRVKFMHGLGIVSQFCENVTYKNCDFTPKKNRTIASTADFFQFSGCKGDLEIFNCKALGAHDDYVNVHGTHLRIIERNDKDNSIVVRFMHNESWGFQAFEKNDELEFIKWDTLIPYEKTMVLAYEKLNDTDILLYLDRALPQNIELNKDVVENVSWTPNLYVKNCNFGETSGRGILCTTRGEVVIENNTFTNLWGPALLIEDDCNFWFESGYTRSITFKNNVVDACEYASMWETAPIIRCTPKVMNEKSTEFVHQKLIIANNTFKNSLNKTHSIWLEYLRNAEITNNSFDNEYSLHTKCVGNILENNNTILNS